MVCQLTVSSTAGLLQEMVRHVDVLQAGQVVMALCHIAVVQPQVTEISKKLVKVIVPPSPCPLQGLQWRNLLCHFVCGLWAVMMMKQYHQILIC